MNRETASSIWQEPFSKFVDNVASSKPVPAGGAVAALSASLAASLLQMVLEIAVKDGANVGDMLTTVEKGREELQHCVEDDIDAFNAFLAARRLPKSTESEKRHRQQFMTQALQRCTEVPLSAARAAAKLVPIAKGLLSLAPDKVLSDFGVALTECDCALVGLSFTVNINLRETASDSAFSVLRTEWAELAREIAFARQDLALAIDQVLQKIGQA